jgi:hypothetical protein
MVLSDHVESIDGMERRAELAGEAEPARHRVLLDPLDLRGTMWRRPTSRSPDRRATTTEGHPLSSTHPSPRIHILKDMETHGVDRRTAIARIKGTHRVGRRPSRSAADAG